MRKNDTAAETPAPKQASGVDRKQDLRDTLNAVRRHDLDNAGMHCVISELRKSGRLDVCQMSSVHYGIDLMLLDRMSLLRQTQRLAFLKVVATTATPVGGKEMKYYAFDLRLSDATLNLMEGKKNYAVAVAVYSEKSSGSSGELLRLFWFNGEDLKALRLPDLEIVNWRDGQSYYLLSGRLGGALDDLRLGASDTALTQLEAKRRKEDRFSLDGFIKALGWPFRWEPLPKRNPPQQNKKSSRKKNPNWLWTQRDETFREVLKGSAKYDKGNSWEHFIIFRLEQDARYDVFHMPGGDYGIDLIVLDRQSLLDRKPRLIFVQVKSAIITDWICPRCKKEEIPVSRKRCPNCKCRKKDYSFQLHIQQSTLNLMKGKRNFVLVAALHNGKEPLQLLWFNGKDLPKVNRLKILDQYEDALYGYLHVEADGRKHLLLQEKDDPAFTDSCTFRYAPSGKTPFPYYQLRADSTPGKEKRMFSVEGLYADLPKGKTRRSENGK